MLILEAKLGKEGVINDLDDKIRSADDKLVAISFEEKSVMELQEKLLSYFKGVVPGAAPIASTVI